MLEGLDAVPWAQLRHAYDTAEDVPGLLREVDAGDAEARSDAITTLFGNVWHQGDVYEATPHAVPFLAEIAACDSVPTDARASIGLLIIEIAHRGPAMYDIPPAVDPDLSEAVRARARRQLERERAARRAVAAQLPRLRSLLAEDSTAMQAVAAGVATQLPDEAASWLGRIEQLQATAPSAPSAALFELAAVLVAGRPVTAELLDHVAAADEDVAEQLAAWRECEVSVADQAHAVAVDLTEQALGQALDA